MKLAAHQPNYLPNLSFFHKMASVDLFVIITNLQFEKQEGWQQRHKIPGPSGDIWLTVPVLGSQNQLIKEVRVNNQLNWRKKHKKTLELIYGKTEEKDFLSGLLSLYDRDWERLADLNIAAIILIKDFLEIKTPLIIDEEVSGVKEGLLINICRKYQADAYLSGVGAKLYLDTTKLEELKKNKIEHQVTDRNLTQEFPYTIVHYLLSQGKDRVLNVI